MKRNLCSFGLILGLAFAAGSLAARTPVHKTSLDADKKEVACVVCGKKVDKATALKINVKGKDQLVCSDACAQELNKNPDKYVNEDGSKKP